MRRFIIPNGTLDGEQATIRGDVFHHMVRVLRMKTNDEVRLVDGRGVEYGGFIQIIGDDFVKVRIDEPSRENPVSSPLRITLYQGMPKGDKLDLIIQKCTELGVDEIIPFTASRSIARPPEHRIQDKLDRWRRIAAESSRQSKRSKVPQVDYARDISTVCVSSNQTMKLILWEDEKSVLLRDILLSGSRRDSLALIIGPEGGLDPSEVEMARQSGFMPVSIGRRIVRTETASMAVVAILQFLWGDLG